MTSSQLKLAFMRKAITALMLAGAGLMCSRSHADELPLAQVAAEYRLEKPADATHAASTQVWRLWRDDNRVVREYPDNQTAEVWQRDAGTLLHTKYFHDAHRGIAFDQADLTMVNALPQWQQVALLVSPQLLKELPMTASGTRDDYPWQRYQGEHGGIVWDITLRTDLMVPVQVERDVGTQHERLTLLNVWPLAQAPWQPLPTTGYDVIDFADLGDHERDPFVVQVQHQLELAHGYEHEHEH